MSRSLFSVPPTPLCPVSLDGGPVIWCKLDFMNPSGSTKDRIARYILGKAWRQGRLACGDTVVEASSGSTSIAMAMACAQLGVRFLALMPEGVSNERVLIIKAYGGEVRFTPKAEGVRGSIAAAEDLGRSPGVFLPRQFSNDDNADAHRVGTAREILDQIPNGTVAAVVSGVGTGGTLVGLFEGFRENGCPVIPVFARPVNVISTPEVECCSFSGRIPGVVDSLSTIFRKDRLPGLRTIEIDDELAIRTTRQLIREGYPVGPSSGLNFLAAVEVATQLAETATPGPVVTVFPDRMERYFTTELFRPFAGT
jgi:cysteine synthase